MNHPFLIRARRRWFLKQGSRKGKRDKPANSFWADSASSVEGKEESSSTFEKLALLRGLEDASSCTPGEVKLRFYAHDAAKWTVVGKFNAPDTIGTIPTKTGQWRGKSTGRVRRGTVDAAAAFTGIIPFWKGVGGLRVVVMLIIIAIVHRFVVVG